MKSSRLENKTGLHFEYGSYATAGPSGDKPLNHPSFPRVAYPHRYGLPTLIPKKIGQGKHSLADSLSFVACMPSRMCGPCGLLPLSSLLLLFDLS